MGHNYFVYLDDGSPPDRTSDVAAPFTQRKNLDSSGLLVNEGKLCWVPMQVARVARFCDRHFFYDVSDSREESLQALAAIKFRYSNQVIVPP